jgi:molecular chaperone GrpE
MGSRTASQRSNLLRRGWFAKYLGIPLSRHRHPWVRAGELRQAGANVTEQEKNGGEPLVNDEDELKMAKSTDQEQGEAETISELELVKAEARENFDKLLRLAAEFENYKKRAEKERSTALKYAEESMIKELLPALDNLERAVEQGRSAENPGLLLEGVELTLKGLTDTLAKFGLKPVQAVDAPFDPNYHEALAMEVSEETPANHIIREFQKGYLYKDRLIRAAKVLVSKGNG